MSLKGNKFVCFKNNEGLYEVRNMVYNSWKKSCIFFCGAGMHHKSKQGAQKMVQRICNNFNPEMWQNDETKCFHIQYSEEIFPFFPLLLNFFQQHKKN